MESASPPPIETLGDPAADDDAIRPAAVLLHSGVNDEDDDDDAERLTGCSVSAASFGASPVSAHEHATATQRTPEDSRNAPHKKAPSTPSLAVSPGSKTPVRGKASVAPSPHRATATAAVPARRLSATPPQKQQHRDPSTPRQPEALDQVTSLRMAHRLALERIVVLERQLQERSEQLIVQQSKVESSREKILALSSAVQTLKGKVEANAKRTSATSSSTLMAKPTTSSTASTQTDVDWDAEWTSSMAVLRDLCVVHERDAAEARASEASARKVSSELMSNAKTITAQLDAATRRIAHTHDWGQQLVYRCLGEEHRRDRDVLAQRWAAMSLEDAARYLDTGDGTTTSSSSLAQPHDRLLQVVAALVGPIDVPKARCVPDATPTGVSPPSQLLAVEEVDAPSPSPIRSRGDEARSLLEELARASVATAASTAAAAIAPPPMHGSPRRDPLGGADDNLIHVRAIEMRLELLRNALFSGGTTPRGEGGGGGAAGGGGLPASLRHGIEAEIAELQRTLEEMALSSVLAIRIASRRQHNVSSFTTSPPRSTELGVSRPTGGQQRHQPQGSSVSLLSRASSPRAVPLSYVPKPHLHHSSDVIELSPAAKDPVGAAVVFCMRSPSEEYSA